MNPKRFGLMVLVTGIVGVIGYAVLGGFNAVPKKVVDVDNYLLAGRYFEGSYKSDTLQQYYMDTKAAIIQGSVTGTLAVVRYLEDEPEDGQVHCFMGVHLNDSAVALPNGWEYRQIVASKAVRASLVEHPMVRPRPYKLDEALRQLGKEAGLTLQNMTIERYFKDDHVEVEVPASN